jgi:DNA repair protein RadA/Sms
MRRFLRPSVSLLTYPTTCHLVTSSRSLGTKTPIKSPNWVCTSCGHDTAKWHGKCQACGELNTVVEFRGSSSTTSSGNSKGKNTSWIGGTSGGAALRLVAIGDVPSGGAARSRIGSSELDRVLGGGLTNGSCTLLCGAPGVGKSTLVLQVAAMICGARRLQISYADYFSRQTTSSSSSSSSSTDTSVAAATTAPAHRVAYISGEESAGQIAARATRLGIKAPGLFLLNETRLEDVLEQLDAAVLNGGLSAAVIDSIQTLSTDAAPGAAGGPGQVRECAVRLTAWAKSSGVPVLLVGHVTKSGDIAGPRVLEHIVDTVLFVEADEAASSAGGGGGGGSDSNTTTAPSYSTAPSQGHRAIRALKNRFGSTAEVGIFELTDEGFAESDPARLLVSAGAAGGPPPGCAVAVTGEGTRALCVEVQALVARATTAFPRLRASGIGADRAHLVAAVLARFTRARPTALGADVLVSAAGGLRVADPAADLAVAMAIASATLGVPLPRGTAFVGEVGLAGELRVAVRVAERLRAAAKLGFTTIYIASPGGGSATAAAAAAATKATKATTTVPILEAAAAGSSLKVIYATTLSEVFTTVFGNSSSSSSPTTTRQSNSAERFEVASSQAAVTGANEEMEERPRTRVSGGAPYLSSSKTPWLGGRGN